MTKEQIESWVKFAAKSSNCSRAHIGCIIVQRSGVISFGYNHNPNEETCDFPDVEGGCGCIHAEVAATGWAHYYLDGSDTRFVVVSIAPCGPCAKVLTLIEPKAVYYLAPSRPGAMEKGLAVFKKAGIPCLLLEGDVP